MQLAISQHLLPILFGVGALVSGCDSHSVAAPLLAPASEVPPSVSIAPSSVVLATALGTLHKTAAVGPLKIAKTPTTVAQYRECVVAGACSTPAVETGACRRSEVGNFGRTYRTDHAADAQPVTCSTPEQAAAYCQWVGGRLPTLSEWLLGARGPQVQRYAWGNAPPTCEQQALRTFGDSQCCGKACLSPESLSVGLHAQGESPMHIADILLTPGERVSADPSSPFPACQPPVTTCLVTGQAPGAIDAFKTEMDQDAAPEMLTVGFRCVWGAPQ